MNHNLTFRIFQPADIDGILNLWKEESGWGEITEKQFNKWINTPFGDCIIAVAADKDGEILGQQIFMPSSFYHKGTEKVACRVLAPILSKKIRTNIRNKNHPFYQMHRVCLEESILQQFRLIYGFPLHAWLPVMHLFPKAGLPKMETAEYECWTLPKANFENFTLLSSDLEATPIADISDEFDELWNSAKIHFPIKCGMVRDAQRLRWKLGGHLVFATRSNTGELIGYVAINKKTGLIVDMLTQKPFDLEDVFASTLNAFNRFELENGSFSFGGIGLMKTKISSTLIKNFGFEKTDYNFAFGCYSIDSEISVESISPINWYMMPDD